MIRFGAIIFILWLITQLGFAIQMPAAEIKPFDASGFVAAQEAGRPILVDIAANSCPVCRAQEPVIESLAARPEFSELVILRVDFDTQRNIVRGFGTRFQSTLIAFRGLHEASRSVGDTNPRSIEALMRRAIAK